MIVSILNLKGGAGKTTLATNLAFRFSQAEKTVLVDTDRQKSSMMWYESRDREDRNLFVNLLTEPKTIIKELPKLDECSGKVVIDGAPNTDIINKICASVSNLVVVPLQPCSFDLNATRQFMTTLREAQATNDALKIMLVVNRYNPRTNISRNIADVLTLIREDNLFSDLKFRIAETRIQNRAVYADAASTGETIYERSNPMARAEFDSLVREITDYINDNKENME